MSKEPIYFESCLTASDNPAQTLYNCQCMLSMKELSGEPIDDSAAVGYSLIMHQVETALDDISERYDFVEKKPD